MGEGGPLVVYGGGGEGFPAILRAISTGPNVRVGVTEDGSLQIDTTTNFSELLDLNEIRYWNYAQDSRDGLLSDISLVEFGGFAENPARKGLLRAGFGIDLDQHENHVLISAPQRPLPLIAGNGIFITQDGLNSIVSTTTYRPGTNILFTQEGPFTLSLIHL